MNTKKIIVSVFKGAALAMGVSDEGRINYSKPGFENISLEAGGNLMKG